MARAYLLEFHLASSPHTVRKQSTFVFCHGSPDLHQEMILWVLPQRLLEELYPTAGVFKFFQQHRLIDIVPC